MATLYGMVNVPNAVWIDEHGRIVRPAEPAGASDAFRRMDRTTLRLPPDAAQEARAVRQAYIDAVRDWVRNGGRCRHVLPPERVRARLAGEGPNAALASLHFRLGLWLWEHGHVERAQRHFYEAQRLRPDDWRYRRQAWHLEEPGKAGGPEFWAAVEALGDKPYYPPLDL